MASYTCEENSICNKFQSAICLHCHRRLCLEHLTEHNKMLVSSITNLSNEMKTTFQQIREESEKKRNMFDHTLSSLNQWRTEQIEKIQQIYDKHLQLIASQREVLEDAEMKLFKQFEENALQSLEHLQRQQNASIEMINHIQQTTEKVREDNAYLKWKLVTPPSLLVDIQYSSLNVPSISLPNQSLHTDSKKSTTKKRPGLTKTVQQETEKAKNDIAAYVKKQSNNFRLPNFIASYLAAWYRKAESDEKVFLLNEHITTIHKYLIKRRRDFDVLIGIQVFFRNEDVKENKNEMMTFLLQFFLDHQCVDQHQILKWYNHKGSLRYEGFNQAKQLASPFIESLLANETVDNIQTVSANPTSIKIKQEPVAMTSSKTIFNLIRITEK